MENFVIYNPTKVYFGKGVVESLGKAVKEYGKKVLLIYGKGSIKSCGIYEQVIDQLRAADAVVTEYSGIKSNPVVEDVDAAAALGRQHDVDFILAVGGGSVIDSAKIVSITIPVDHSGWDFYVTSKNPKKAIPVVTVLTLAATGSEMNKFAVVQNNQTKQKFGYGHNLLYPRQSFLDPSYTFSVPRNYTAYGIADLLAHCLESFFGNGDTTLTDKFIISIIKEAEEYGPKLLQNLTDYRLRAKIMFAATMALNGTTLLAKKSGDWGVHAIGHVLSALYDIPHGASLTIAYPAWLKLQKDEVADKISALGINLFGTPDVNQTIASIEDMFRKIECPVSLKEVNAGPEKKKEIIDTMKVNNVNGATVEISEQDYEKLVDLML